VVEDGMTQNPKKLKSRKKIGKIILHFCTFFAETLQNKEKLLNFFVCLKYQLFKQHYGTI